MSDFYSILKQSIVDRGLRTPAQREEVYGQARTAMIRKLWSLDPPLAEDEIDGRIGSFDRAVERIETDLVAMFAGTPARPAQRPARVAAPTRAAPAADPYDDEADFVPAVPAARAAPPARRPAASPPAQRPRHDPLAERSAAIEAALRGDYAGRRAEDADAPADDDAAHHDEARGYDRAGDDEDVFLDERDGDEEGGYERLSEDDDSEGIDDREEPEEDAPARRPARRPARPRKVPSPAAHWAGLSERGKIRALIGAIAALGIVLLVAGTYVVMALLSDRPSGPVASPTPPQGGTVGTPAAATAIAGEAADVVQSYMLFDGSDPTAFESTPDNPVRFEKDADGAGMARVSSSAGSPGVRINIGPGIADRLAGQPVRIVIVARMARESGAANMRFAYQSGVALSHWQPANLATADTSYGLVWRVPKMRTDPNGDYVLIEPGIPGDGTAADIRSVRVDLLAKEPG